MSTTTDTKNSTDALVAKMQAKANAKAPHKDKESRSAKWRSFFRSTLTIWFFLIVSGVVLYAIGYAFGWADGFNHARKDPDYKETFNLVHAWEGFVLLVLWTWWVIIPGTFILAAVAAGIIKWDPLKSKPKSDHKKH